MLGYGQFRMPTAKANASSASSSSGTNSNVTNRACQKALETATNTGSGQTNQFKTAFQNSKNISNATPKLGENPKIQNEAKKNSKKLSDIM